MATVTKKDDKEKKSRKQSRPGLRVDERIMEAGEYEIPKDSTFPIDIYLKKVAKRWIVCLEEEKEAVHEQVTMRMWTYDEMTEMKKMSTTYDPIKRIHMIDHDALNQLKMQKLMVSWTFGDNNPNLKIFHINGVLVDESWKSVKKLYPTILNYIIAQMNAIYDNNG